MTLPIQRRWLCPDVRKASNGLSECLFRVTGHLRDVTVIPSRVAYGYSLPRPLIRWTTALPFMAPTLSDHSYDAIISKSAE